MHSEGNAPAVTEASPPWLGLNAVLRVEIFSTFTLDGSSSSDTMTLPFLLVIVTGQISSWNQPYGGVIVSGQRYMLTSMLTHEHMA